MARIRAVLIVIVLAAGSVGCTPAPPGASGASPDNRPTTTAPATGSPTTPAPSPRESAAPSSTPLPTSGPPPEPTPIDGDLVLRVDEINAELGAAFAIPLLSVYADGGVILVDTTDDDAVYGQFARYRRLSAAGLRAVLEVAAGKRLLVTSDPAGKQLASLDDWLPRDAWEVGPDRAVTWVPARYMLAVRVHDGFQPLGSDVADVWPLDAPFASFGDAVADDHPSPPDRQLRCGVVGLEDAIRVEAGFEPTDRLGVPAEITTYGALAWSAESAWAELLLEPLLPDEPATCESLSFYP